MQAGTSDDALADKTQLLANKADTLAAQITEHGGQELKEALMLALMRDTILDAPNPYIGLATLTAATAHIASLVNTLPEETGTEH